MVTAHINAVGIATPPHDVHQAFRLLIEQSLETPRERTLFRRMADRAGIEHRFSFCRPVIRDGVVSGDAEGLYSLEALPSTAARMSKFEAYAPQLALQAVSDLRADFEPDRITHLVVACCT